MNKEFDEDRKSIRKVLLVVRWPIGGIRTFLKYVMIYFPSGQYEFSLVGAETDGMKALQKEIGHLIKSWRLVSVKGGDQRSFYSAVTDEMNRNDFDLVHAHGFTSLICSLKAAIFSKTLMICTSHDVLNAAQFLGFKGGVKKYLLRFALGRCQIIQSVSVDAEENLRSFFPKIVEKKGAVVLNGVDTAHFFQAQKVDLRSQFGDGNQHVVIGFFGRFMNQKGFRYLVEALEILLNSNREYEFYVLCFGSGAFIREEKSAISERGLSEYFSFYPFSPDVSGAMKGCDVIAMPSLWEACPLQPMEALCAGVPFVGSDCIGLREVLSGTPAVMVKSGDAESLADGILECIRKGRKPFEEYAPLAVERFDARRTALGIHEMYDRLLG
ncbi:MAG: glycosyltransferase family 4 protein [Marinobacter sp.]|uniref:glycosyltransferase family 4 protein n=1 Tax=Marinobacter sp. TaxID=50741 RepID=UPI003299DA06